MLTTRVNPSRCYWHLLFAAETVETVKDAKGRERTERWDAARLRALVQNRDRFDAHVTSNGSGRQPWPVSYHHAIERRQYFGEELENGQLDRAGNGWGLVFHPGGPVAEGGPDVTAGVYGLIEWTWPALGHIEDGSLIVLSPTTTGRLVSTDGESFGEALVAVGLVDVAKLQNIGTARNGLPIEAFPVPADVVPAEKNRLDNRSARVTVPEDHTEPVVVMRSALHLEEVHMSEQQAAKRSADEMFAEIEADPEMYAEMCARVEAKMAEMKAADAPMEPPAETKADELPADAWAKLDTILDRLDRVERMVGKAAAASSEAADAVEDATDHALLAEARRVQSGVVRERVLALVRDGKLLGDANVRAARAALMNGEPVDRFLVASRSAGEPQPAGVVDTSTKQAEGGGVPVEVFEDDLYMRAERETMKDGLPNPAAAGKLFLQMRADALAAGTTIRVRA
jgi:hypothetical protein